MIVGSIGNSFNKEVSIRRRITSIFNKREDDFRSLKEYNDYLEDVEDMTWNLIEGRDVTAIEAKIAEYEEENKEHIVNTRARKAEEQATASAAIQGRHCHGYGYGDTHMVTDQGMSVSAQGQYAPTVAFMQPRPMRMAYQQDEELMRLRAERGGRGWTPEFYKKRAVEEAFGNLWL